MWPNIHIIYVHIYIYIRIYNPPELQDHLGTIFSAFAIFWRMRSGDVMMIRKSAEIASKSSDVQNISGYCQYREAGCKTGSFTIFYTNRFQPEKMFRKYLAKEQGKLRKHSSCAAFWYFSVSMSRIEACIAAELFISFAFKFFAFQSLPPVCHWENGGQPYLSKPLWSLSCHTSFSWHIVMSLEKCVCRLHTKPAIWSIFTYISVSYMNYFNHYTSTQNPASFWFKNRQ